MAISLALFFSLFLSHPQSLNHAGLRPQQPSGSNNEDTSKSWTQTRNGDRARAQPGTRNEKQETRNEERGNMRENRRRTKRKRVPMGTCQWSLPLNNTCPQHRHSIGNSQTQTGRDPQSQLDFLFYISVYILSIHSFYYRQCDLCSVVLSFVRFVLCALQPCFPPLKTKSKLTSPSPN